MMPDLFTNLEFGNPEQIKEIRRREKLAESNTWEMELEISGSMSVTVKAESKEEAKAKACEENFDALIDWATVETHFVRKVEPEEQEEDVMEKYKESKKMVNMIGLFPEVEG